MNASDDLGGSFRERLARMEAQVHYLLEGQKAIDEKLNVTKELLMQATGGLRVGIWIFGIVAACSSALVAWTGMGHR